MKEGIIKYCSRCKAAFECNTANIEQCHCYTIQLTTEEAKAVAAQYKDCLCYDCLNSISERKEDIITSNREPEPAKHSAQQFSG